MTVAWRSADFAPALVPAWRTPLALLAGAWFAILVLFHADVGDLAFIYWNSTNFGHCLFVLPVVGWLIWLRRAELSHLTPQGWWPGLAIVAAGGVAWFMGQVSGVAFARHLGLVVMLQGSIVALLGPNVARGIAFPLFYLIFLVPFGEWLEKPLQDVTVAITMPLLHSAGVPASVDGVLITIPNGWFEVAEACSGTKFVIGMLAFATLVGHVCFTSWRRRAIFFAAAMVVPVIANGLRAFGTIYAAHLTSVEAATGADHIVYGWVFFAAVMAAVLAIGWRWFDRDPDAPAFDPARLQAPATRRTDNWAATGAVIGLATLAFWGGSAIIARADALPARMELPDVPGWHRVALEDRVHWSPNYPTADHYLIGGYADAAGRRVDLAVAVYSGQREGHELVSFGQGVIRENDRWVRIADEAPLQNGSVMRITGPGAVERVVATWYRVGGVTTASERMVKIETLKAKLSNGEQRASALHLSAVAGRGDARAAMTSFLAAAGAPGDIADRVAHGR